MSNTTTNSGTNAAQDSAFPDRDTSKPAEQQGMFRKFNVSRVDGSDVYGGKHFGCRYFVLDLSHDLHAVAAMRAYAVACRATHSQLADDIEAEFGAAQDSSAPVPAEDPRITAFYKLRDIAERDGDPESASVIASAIAAHQAAARSAPVGQDAMQSELLAQCCRARNLIETKNPEAALTCLQDAIDAAAIRALIATPSTNGEQQSGDSELLHVGTLSVFEDKEATFGHAYDISTNKAGHEVLQGLDGAELFARKQQRAASNGNSEGEKA